jgi:hypothetical protein
MFAICGTDQPVAAETVQHLSCVLQAASLEIDSQLHWAQCTSCQKWRLVSAEISVMAEVHDQTLIMAARCTMHAEPHRIQVWCDRSH